MLISSIALLAFMFFVSFNVWPQAVLFVSFLAGVLVTLQYLLFGAHRLALGIRWVFKRIGAGFARLFSQGKEAEPTEKEKVDDSPKPAIDVVKDKVAGDEEKEKENEPYEYRDVHP
jgi:CBS domain containing-hemolysin-like protein